MLRELAPNASAPTAELIEQPTAEQAAAFYAAAHKNGFSFALDAEEPTEAEPEADEPELHQTMSLLDGVEEAETKAESSIGVSAEPGKGLCLPLTPELKALFEDPFVPKRVHDLKLALHVLCGLGVELRGKLDDSQLLSYVLNPTHTTQTLAEVAARHNQTPPNSLAASAAITQILATDLRAEAERSSVTTVYETIDLPLAPVPFRMEKSGVRIDKGVLSHLSSCFGAEIERVSERVFELAGERFNIGSPKKLGEVLFNRMDLPNARQVREGQDHLHRPRRFGAARREIRGLSARTRIPAFVQA